MCLLWSTNRGFISQKATFFIVPAVKTSNLTIHITFITPIPLHHRAKRQGSASKYDFNVPSKTTANLAGSEHWREEPMWNMELSVMHQAGTPTPVSIRVLSLYTTNILAFSQQANYTDWATATCWRNLMPTFVDRRVSRGQRGGSRTVVNLKFLDRSRYFSIK
jgi:hypothetical protein